MHRRTGNVARNDSCYQCPSAFLPLPSIRTHTHPPTQHSLHTLPALPRRTALMLACVRGHRDVVELLLSAGADARLDDNLGRCALLEACYHGHDTLIDVLLRHGVRLSASYIGGSGPSGTTSPGRGRSTSGTGSTGSASPAVVQSGAAVASSSSLVAAAATAAAWSLRLASLLCSAVYECNLPLLRRLLRAGAPVNAGDYDLRTPLHVSAAEGNLVMVRTWAIVATAAAAAAQTLDSAVYASTLHHFIFHFSSPPASLPLSSM